MGRRRATAQAEAGKRSLPDYVDQATEYVVRAVELILLASVFGYAAIESGSVAASIVAGVILVLACLHVGARAVYRFGNWLETRYPGSRYWCLAAIVVLAILAALIVVHAVMALFKVIVLHAN